MKDIKDVFCYLLFAICLFWNQAVAENIRQDNSVKNRSFVRGAPTPTWVEKVPEVPRTSHTDSLVVRLSDTQVQNEKEVSTYYFRAIQVNSREALGFIDRYMISYVPDYQRLLVHQVAILRQGQQYDQTSTVKMHLLQRERQLEVGMIGGQVSLQMLLSDVRIGDTLLVSYTISGENPVFAGRWSNTFAWDSAAPTEHRRLIVSHRPEKPLFWAQRGDFKATPIPFKEASSERIRKLIFEERALDAIDEESGTPSDYVPGRVLEFTEYRDWREVAVWGGKLFPTLSPNEDLKMLIQKFSKENTLEKRAAAALYWIQNEIRYFSMSLGINSHKPRSPALVLNTRFGDCKDKSYLLIALLAGLGIKAEPVLISAEAPRYPLRALPSPLMFDHVIVRANINGSSYFVDPTRTGQVEELARLPVAMPNAAGLVVEPASENLMVLPDDPHELPQFEIAERFVLPSLDGEGRFEARRTYQGNYAAAMRRIFGAMSASAMKKYALSLYEKNYPGLTLASPPSVIEEGGNTVLITQYVIGHPLSVSEEKHQLIVTSKVLEGVLDLPDKIVRNYPFALSGGRFRGRHIVQITWPESSRLNNEVGARTLDNRYFRYHHEYFLRGNTLHYQMDFANKVDRIDAAEMPQLQEEKRGLEKMFVNSFSIAADSIVSERVQELRHRDIVGRLSAISFNMGGRSWTKDVTPTPEDWCLYLLQGYLGLDFLPESERENVLSSHLRETGRVERKEPKRCFGALAFMRQDFNETVRYLGDSSLEGGNTLVPKLAWARFFQSDTAGALQDMRRYYDHKVAMGINSPTDLIQYVALLRRARAEVPDQLKMSLTEQSSAVWPRPVVAFLAGRTDADALLTSAESLSGDAREFAMAEAWYYIGLDRLMNGDKGGARRAFRYLLANGVRSTMEYMLAKAEIDALLSQDPDYIAGSDAEAAKKYTLAAAHYEKAVSRGDAQAAYALGLLYYYGNGTAIDKVRALSLIRKGAEGDIPGAQNMMGCYFDDGDGGIVRDAHEAEKWFSLAAGQYDLHGMRNLGNLLVVKGELSNEQFDRAMSYLQQAAGMGLHVAQANLGDKLQDRKPIFARFWSEASVADGNTEHLVMLGQQLRSAKAPLQDGERARRILTPLAKEGNIKAQLELGILFEYGQGVEKDQKLAVEWFEKAARQGSFIGKMRLARCYLYGTGVEKDFEKAAKLLHEASDGNVPYANYLLGNLYEKGHGVERDKQRAMAYYERAAADGIASAQTAIGNLFYFAEQGRDKAVQWYRKAAENGSSIAMNNLGDMYENGVGVPQDFLEAMRLYRQAAALGEGVAFRSLAWLLASGKAGKTDIRQAYLYYLLAAKIEKNIAKEASALREKLGADELRALEAQAEKWKEGDPVPGI